MAEAIMTLSTGLIKCQQQQQQQTGHCGRCRPESQTEGNRPVSSRSLTGRVFPLSAVVLYSHHGRKVVLTLPH